MEHVFSCAFASGCEFTTKNLKIKIVRERYVFAGPLRSALPPPPWPHAAGWRRMHQGKPAGGHWVI